MMTKIMEKKVAFIFSVVATLIDFIVLMVATNVMDFSGNGQTVWFTTATVLAVITMLLAGGLKMALKVVIKGFSFGMILPFFPINILLALMCAAFVGGMMILFPFIGVIIACFTE